MLMIPFFLFIKNVLFMFTVLARVKLSFTDTVIRFEHLPKDTITGIGLQIHIRRQVYSAQLVIMKGNCYSEPA